MILQGKKALLALITQSENCYYAAKKRMFKSDSPNINTVLKPFKSPLRFLITKITFSNHDNHSLLIEITFFMKKKIN